MVPFARGRHPRLNEKMSRRRRLTLSCLVVVAALSVSATVMLWLRFVSLAQASHDTLDFVSHQHRLENYFAQFFLLFVSSTIITCAVAYHKVAG
jgi:hypothetical protein